jgi:hypothetical protein
MFHHHAHTSKLFVKEGDRVTKGQLIGLVGRSGLAAGAGAHDHYEARKSKPPKWSFYPRGWTRDRVSQEYVDPRIYVDESQTIPVPWTNKNAGYKYLEYAAPQDTFHPGIDFNSGYGDQDIGNPIKATTDGIVRYVGIDGSWGLHVWTEETASLNLPISPKVQLVFNNQKYANELTLIGLARDRMLSLSGGKVLFDYAPIIYTDYKEIPVKVFMDAIGQQDTAVDKDWFIDNVWSLNKDADIVIFIGKPGDWENTHENITTYGHYYSELPATFPALIQIVAGETDKSWRWPELPAFIHYVTHEVSHPLQQMSGQDKTHEFDYASVDGLAQVLPNLDFHKINEQLTYKSSYERNASVFIKKENDSTIYLNEADVLVPFSASFENFLADFPNAKVITVTSNEFLKFRIANKVVIKDR